MTPIVVLVAEAAVSVVVVALDALQCGVGFLWLPPLSVLALVVVNHQDISAPVIVVPAAVVVPAVAT